MKSIILSNKIYTFEAPGFSYSYFQRIPELLQYLREAVGAGAAVLLYEEQFTGISELLMHIRYCYPEIIPISLQSEMLSEELTAIDSHCLSIKHQDFHADLIQYIEKSSRKVLFHMKEHVRSITMSIASLPDMSAFGLARCHESYIVNLNAIKAVDGQNFVLKDSTVIPVSRPYLSLLQKYRRLLRREQSSV